MRVVLKTLHLAQQPRALRSDARMPTVQRT